MCRRVHLTAPHLSIESDAVVATEETLLRVHHLGHLQIGAVDVIV